MNAYVLAGAQLTFMTLSREEVMVLLSLALTDSNPKGTAIYSKVDHLFTEASGTRMHTEMLTALVQYIEENALVTWVTT